MDEGVWRKSSRSAHNGNCAEVLWCRSSHSTANGNCVEIGFRKSSHSYNSFDCVEVAYRKSSHSNSNGCVEVADGCGLVHVRDSKDPDGPQLAFSPADWQAFVDSLKVP